MQSPPLEWTLGIAYLATLDYIRSRGEADGDTLSEVVRDTARRHPKGDLLIGVGLFLGAEVLRRHPLVEDAAVRLMRPDEGTRLKAFVVASRGGDEVVEQLKAYIDQQLPAPERPKAITFGTALPKTAEGKPADWSIAS